MKGIALLCTLGILAGCGLADTATSAAIGAGAKAKEAEQAREIQDKMLKDLQQAQQQADQRLRDADSK